MSEPLVEELKQAAVETGEYQERARLIRWASEQGDMTVLAVISRYLDYLEREAA